MPYDKGSLPAQVTGASKLIDLYGYWISFHDAVVESITVERIGPTVTICFTTCDMVCHGEEIGEPNQQAKVVIRWYGVGDMSLQGIDPAQHNWIDGLTFSTQPAGIRSGIELMDALHGFIFAQRAEILSVLPV